MLYNKLNRKKQKHRCALLLFSCKVGVMRRKENGYFKDLTQYEYFKGDENTLNTDWLSERT
jgi:hypothetical protein